MYPPVSVKGLSDVHVILNPFPFVESSEVNLSRTRLLVERISFMGGLVPQNLPVMVKATGWESVA